MQEKVFLLLIAYHDDNPKANYSSMSARNTELFAPHYILHELIQKHRDFFYGA